MTKDEINRAIAEWVGYENIHYYDSWKEGPSRRTGDLVGDFGGVTKRHLPNYHGDLNAVHEAEKRLNKTEDWNYRCKLFKIFSPHPDSGLYQAMTATAPQRCEALLRTLGKWMGGDRE